MSIASIQSKPIQVTLFDHQVETFNKLLKHIQTSFMHFNTSPTGSGKTPLIIKIAQVFGFDLLVIGPANIQENWYKECTKYGVKCIFISYTVLGRTDARIKYVEFDSEGNCKVGKAFYDLIQKPVYLVLDEAQGTKNDDSNCTIACCALMAATRQLNNGSRAALLSATPMDKEEQVETAYKMMGVMTAKDLFEHDLGRRQYRLEGHGYLQIVEYCRKLDSVLTAQMEVKPSDYKAKNFRHAIYLMYVNIVKPRYIFSMPKPNIKAKFLPSHTYFRINDQEEFNKIKEAVNRMRYVTGYSDDGSLDPGIKMGAVVKMFGEVEYSKVGLFTRVAKRKLDSDPKCKVVIYVWQDKLGTVDELMANLAAYGTLRCDGKVLPKKRQINKNLFNEHNTNYRVIIAKPTAFGVGHSIDDTSNVDPHGQFKRHFLMSPNYNFEKLHQGAGRGYRATTTSDVTCTLVYVDGTDEASIINALATKKEVTKDVVQESEEGGEKSIYPGEYPVNHENS